MLAVVWRLLYSTSLAVSATGVVYSWASVASALMATAGCCDGVLATATPERAEASWSQFVTAWRRLITYQNNLCKVLTWRMRLEFHAPCWAPSEVPRASEEL